MSASRTIQFDLPESLLLAFKNTPEEMTRMIRMAAAAKLYEMGKISTGRAAELAGVPRVTFLGEMGRYGVSLFELTQDELEHELQTLDAHLRHDD